MELQPTCSEGIFKLKQGDTEDWVKINISDLLKLKKTDKVVCGLTPDKRFEELIEIFKEYSSGKITRKEYIAKILARLFWR